MRNNYKTDDNGEKGYSILIKEKENKNKIYIALISISVLVTIISEEIIRRKKNG